MGYNIIKVFCTIVDIKLSTADDNRMSMGNV